MTITDPITAFIDHMRSVDCGPSSEVHVEADDKKHYYRLDGDKPKTEKGAYCLKVEHDGFAVGWCMNFRDGIVHKWHTKASRKITDEQRAEWKRRTAEARARQERELAEQQEAAHQKAKLIWGEAAREGSNPYLDRKGFTVQQIGCRMSRGKVVVPMWAGKKLVGLQFIDDDGKLFLKGCAKEGAYHAIPGEGDLIVVGEGLATMAAIQASLGCSVVVAFDAGNLKPVAQAMKLAYPDKRVVFAADADQWTIPRVKDRPEDYGDMAGDDPRWTDLRAAGVCVNTGADKAAQAAVSIGGAVVVAPPFPPDDPAKRTDWWDYWREHGDAAVKAAFETAMTAPPPPEYLPEDQWEPDYGEPLRDTTVSADDPWRDNPVLRAVRPLGRDGKRYYFFPRQFGQILDYSGPELASIQTLVGLAPRSLWEANFDTKGGDKRMASEASLMLIEACSQKGVYRAESERGVGVWMDEGRAVFNAGDRVYWVGGDCLPPDYHSKNVYVMGPKIGALISDQMDNQEASEILRICLSLSWKHKAAGYMLAGWMVSAIIAGAIRWRSHIVLTGEKGAGKSWVLDNIVKEIMGRLALTRDGGTTESGLRQDISGTSQAVIMDESESETARDRTNMEQIFMLARKSSSGAVVRNANGLYPIRSSFCFAAINPRIIQGADLDRNTILHLVVNRADSAGDDFRKLQKRVAAAITEESADRLFARCFNNLPTILKNIETFSDVLEEQEGSKRFGDQYGTLVAGAYSLTSTAEISREAAAAWCAKHDWRWAKSDNDQSDSDRLLQFILSARVRYDDRGMAREANVGRLIDRALHAEGGDRDTAVAALGEYGMQVNRDWFLVASPCKPMADLLRDTPWGGSYRRALGEMDGAEARDKVRFTPSLRARAVAIPLRHVLAEDAPDEQELPFDAEDYR